MGGLPGLNLARPRNHKSNRPGTAGAGRSNRQNGPARSNHWLHYLVPSTADLIFVLFLACLVTGPIAVKLLGDAGIGWHIRTGELILESKTIPRLDPFSSTMNGQPWYAWEWLYDVVVGAFHRVAGLNGVVFLNALAIAATFAYAFRKMTDRGTGVLLAVILVLVAAVASSVHFLARPHVFSWLLTLIWFEFLRSYESTGNVRRLFWLLPITLAWVNVHGGFLVGFVLLGAYCLGSALTGFFNSSMTEAHGPVAKSAFQKAGYLALAGVACAVTTLANPYGYRLHAHIYRYLTDRFLMEHIDEFLSPNFHGLPQKFFAITIVLAIIAAATARRQMSISGVLVMLFAVYSGLYATRNIPISALLLVMIIGPHLSESLGSSAREGPSQFVTRMGAKYASFEQRMAALDRALKGHWLPDTDHRGRRVGLFPRWPAAECSNYQRPVRPDPLSGPGCGLV